MPKGHKGIVKYPQMTLYISPELRQAVQVLCVQEDRSESWIIRQLLKEALYARSNPRHGAEADLAREGR